ncbi:MAG: DnaB-like helicase C-terminal domain-containing protein, partial [Reyranella sp.]
GKAEVIVAKQRHGPVGIVRLAFEGQFTKFGNLAADEERPAGPAFE